MLFLLKQFLINTRIQFHNLITLPIPFPLLLCKHIRMNITTDSHPLQSFPNSPMPPSLHSPSSPILRNLHLHQTDKPLIFHHTSQKHFYHPLIPRPPQHIIIIFELFPQLIDPLRFILNNLRLFVKNIPV